MVKEVPPQARPREAMFNRQPAIVIALAGAIVAAHVARILAPGDLPMVLEERFSVVPLAFEQGLGPASLTPLIGHVFVHAGWVHLIFNMTLFLAVGGPVARRLGAAGGGAVRFLALFFSCAVISALTFVAFNRGSPVGAIGASGAICGVFSAYLMGARWDWRASLRDRKVLMAGFWFLALNVGLAAVVRQIGVMPIAWEAHLGGFIAGMVLFPLLAPKFANSQGPWA